MRAGCARGLLGPCPGYALRPLPSTPGRPKLRDRLIFTPLPSLPIPNPRRSGYVLDADSPAALRPHWDRRAQRRIAATAGSKNLKAVQAGWGDAAADAGPLNPHFKDEALTGYRCSQWRLGLASW